MIKDSQNIEEATTAMSSAPTSDQPDNKTRRYDRQLRLWASSGQAALESSRILVLTASATSTSILKNLVLPGIGHFTLLDPHSVSPSDAGNNFFLEGPDSIGKKRSEEAVRLLVEMNEGVEGVADTATLESRLSDTDYLSSFSLVIAHNLPSPLLTQLSTTLWSSPSTLPPLIAVRSAGFLAEFHIQLSEHTIVDSHTESAPSLRVDKAFDTLKQYALGLNLEKKDGEEGVMDSTDHAHVPYVVILVKALEIWKKDHDGKAPQNTAERNAFKSLVASWKRKADEENFDEALSQAYRAWSSTGIPYDIRDLFDDPRLKVFSSTGKLPEDTPLFFHLLAALKEFTQNEDGPKTLPLSSTLPDMKADTKSYVNLQTLYKDQARRERDAFVKIFEEKSGLKVVEGKEASGNNVPSEVVDDFVRNSHALRVLRGRSWAETEKDSKTLVSLLANPDEARVAATHLALTALSHHLSSQPHTKPPSEAQLTEIIVKELLPEGTELPEEIKIAVGEVVRTPTADLPNTAAFLGGLVAQEAIKVITKQYVPVNGLCVVDLIGSWTGIIN